MRFVPVLILVCLSSPVWAQSQVGEFGPSTAVRNALTSINPQTDDVSVRVDRDACRNPEAAVDAVVVTFLSLTAGQRTPTRIRSELITEFRARVSALLQFREARRDRQP